MFSRCETLCPICGKTMDWMRGIGREARCCSSHCNEEFLWRQTLAILGKEYYAKPETKPNE